MGTTTEKPLLTFEEFERLPDRPGKRELLKGELIELPPAELKHDRHSRRIFKTLDAVVEAAHARGEAQDLGEVCIETGYYLSETGWLVPDVSIAHTGQAEGKYFEGAPAIAIEVMSPSNRAPDVQAKTQLYFEFGAREVWHFYPKTRRVVVFSGSGEQSRTEREFVATPLLPDFRLNLAEIFAD